MLTLTECPRDAWQGLHHFIPTETKAAYLNQLLQVGFDVLDFGSFVSPKAIPQMKDTSELVPLLNLDGSDTRLLAIVLNERGANDALAFEEVSLLGFPYSVSPTFQQRNANQTLEQAYAKLETIANATAQAKRELLVYLSMGFGNPYGDAYSPEVLLESVEKIAPLGVKVFALADTVGNAQPALIQQVFSELIASKPELTFGAHFHSSPTDWRVKVAAAWAAGCRRFDAALQGFGGCPFAADDLVGNLATENLLAYLQENAPKELPALDTDRLAAASQKALLVFG